MSRSFKHKPMAAICGGNSAQHDKTLAARGVRRKHRQVLHIALTSGEYDVVLPHRLQCCHNETYSWGRDGGQQWMVPSDYDWKRHLEANDPEAKYRDENYVTWPPQWYQRLMRK